jgi:hypothetical protein
METYLDNLLLLLCEAGEVAAKPTVGAPDVSAV